MDFGGIVWYSTLLPETELEISLFSKMGDSFQRLNSQVPITGWRRLGSNILLEFTEGLPENPAAQPSIFVPKSNVHVHIAAPGPCACNFSSLIAHGFIETMDAICTFALGRPVKLPIYIRRAKSEALPELKRKIRYEDPYTRAEPYFT
jgi:hypothetical protein